MYGWAVTRDDYSFLLYTEGFRITYNASHDERNQVSIANIAAAFLVLAAGTAALDTSQPVLMNMLWYSGLALIQLV